MPMPLVSLLAIPINNPFPVTLALSIASIFAFGIELAIARLRIHPSKWVYVLLAACMALAAILMAWSGYYALYGPPAAEPITHFGMPGASYDFYLTVWKANVVAFLVTGLLVLVMGIALARRKA